MFYKPRWEASNQPAIGERTAPGSLPRRFDEELHTGSHPAVADDCRVIEPRGKQYLQRRASPRDRIRQLGKPVEYRHVAEQKLHVRSCSEDLLSGCCIGRIAHVARQRCLQCASAPGNQRRMSDGEVMSRQVQPVSLQTRWSLVPGSARL
jgi:hypothetical protein